MATGALFVGCGHSGEEKDRADRTLTAPPAASPLDRSIRVLLRQDLDRCRLAVEGSLDLQNPDGGAVLAEGIDLPHFSVELAPGRITFPDLGQSFAVTTVDVLPRGSGTVAVEMDDGQWRHYRGWLRLTHTPDLRGAVINVVDVETYLVGVVAAEMPSSFHAEAFRAQAVAARTYAWYLKQTTGRHRVYDVTATESTQVYAGLERESQVPQAARAVRDTCGRVCTWTSPEGERIFCAYYSSTCGGCTQAAASVNNQPPIPPLAGNVRCDYCSHSPTYRWGPVALSKAFITERLRERYPEFESIGPIDRLEVTERTPGGRPLRLTLFDAAGKAIELNAGGFRLAINRTDKHLKSAFFTPVIEPDAIVFTEGRGSGHGIGMCQYGADGLAQAGRSAEEILTFYYPSSRVTLAY